MVIAALVVFAGLLAAWILAPTEASPAVDVMLPETQAPADALAEAA